MNLKQEIKFYSSYLAQLSILDTELKETPVRAADFSRSFLDNS